ncbi:MAG: trehalose-6-phosphate synthase [Firmicutes bacterium ML8_F2]|nr:MAG: trehalose-6-phosphate synthase [Firmicutes bacterium ML8_F2]
MTESEHDLHDKRVIIVSNRLPVSVSRKRGSLKIVPSVGGLATGLSSFHKQQNGLWVGWPGIKPGSQKSKSEIENILRSDYNCLPVFLSDAELKKYYYGFSNRTLWPLFHYFSTYCTYDPSEWETYKYVNQIFCDRILEVIKPGDMVWVHDYHLLLLPEMLRRETPDTTIGFFLHIPFPSMEIFRHLPWREKILRGMLGADLIGFHTYDYTRHFLSCCLRILGLEQVYGQVITDNRMVKVDTFPMGIDADKFSETAKSPTVVKKVKRLQKKLQTEKIILSVDRLDFTKGIPERLRAFELFLERYPHWHKRITYVLLCVPSRSKVQEYRLLKKEIDELVGRINGRFDTTEWQPILYMYRSLPFEELISLYSAADLALVTPLRDGMNLVAKEYLACQCESGKGTLVLSETAGSAAELGEAIIVNPNDIEMTADAIARGLSVPENEVKNSVCHMAGRIKEYNIFRWTEDFITHLAETEETQELNRQHFLTDKHQQTLKDNYEKASRRLLMLDYDGTLVSLEKRPELAQPDPELLDMLTKLKEDPKNSVVIVSGRDKECLSSWLNDTGVEMVAEHGTWIRVKNAETWRLSTAGLTDEWKKNIYPILRTFSVRTPGSFVEEKAFALAWHYRKADPALGNLRSKELMDALHDILAGTELQILQGNKVLEIKPMGVNKGKAALYWLGNEQPWDFIMAAGDDWTDEDIFAVLPEKAWSIKVGFVPFTRARFFLESPEKLKNILRNLIAVVK